MTLTGSDRSAARDLIDRYCSALDTRDFAKLISCFTADAEIVHRAGAQRFADREHLAQYLAATLAGYRSTIHAFANLDLEEEGDGTVHARYLLVVNLAPGDEDMVIVRGVSYDDEFTRAQGGWAIARRLHTPLWQYRIPSDKLT